MQEKKTNIALIIFYCSLLSIVIVLTWWYLIAHADDLFNKKTDACDAGIVAEKSVSDGFFSGVDYKLRVVVEHEHEDRSYSELKVFRVTFDDYFTYNVGDEISISALNMA